MVKRLIFSLKRLGLFVCETGWLGALEPCPEHVPPTEERLAFAFTKALDLGKLLAFDLRGTQDAMFRQTILELGTDTRDLRIFDIAARKSIFNITLLRFFYDRVDLVLLILKESCAFPVCSLNDIPLCRNFVVQIKCAFL